MRQPARNDRPDARIEQALIADLYNGKAPVYDIWTWLTESRARNLAIELAGIKDGQYILEVAVGTGLAFYELVKRNPSGNNIGVDLSPGMLARATKRLCKLDSSNYTLEIGSAFALGLANDSVDILLTTICST